MSHRSQNIDPIATGATYAKCCTSQIKFALSSLNGGLSTRSQAARGNYRAVVFSTEGRSIFLPEAKAAIQQGKINCDFLQSPFDMYRATEAPPKSKHGLTKWVTDRGESCLEMFHRLLAHFANMDMRASLADALGLAGTARFNMRMRLKMKRQADLPEENGRIPAFFRDEPIFFNHSNLHAINARARSCGSQQDRHTKLEILGEDNGERFFSEYLIQQRERRQSSGWISTARSSKRCQCPMCAENPIPLPMSKMHHLILTSMQQEQHTQRQLQSRRQ